MLFSRKPSHPQLHMYNITIEHVESHKHLGITISSDANWSKHISLMLDKAWTRIGLIRSLKYHLNRPCLENNVYVFLSTTFKVRHNNFGQLHYQKSDIEFVQMDMHALLPVQLNTVKLIQCSLN